jgi:hypothetical protein
MSDVSGVSEMCLDTCLDTVPVGVSSVSLPLGRHATRDTGRDTPEAGRARPRKSDRGDHETSASLLIASGCDAATVVSAGAGLEALRPRLKSRAIFGISPLSFLPTPESPIVSGGR